MKKSVFRGTYEEQLIVYDDADATPFTTAKQVKQETEERARRAAERRNKLMAQMTMAQSNFIKSNADMFASTTAVAQTSHPTMMKSQEEDEEGAWAYKTTACLGVDRRLQQPEEHTFTCISCFEPCNIKNNGPTLVYLAFMQKSKVLPDNALNEYSLHSSSCGHVMHDVCWQEYYNNEKSKEQRRSNRNRPPLLSSIDNTEFQCPYCRCQSNTVLPLTAPLSRYSMPIVIHAGDELFPIDLWIAMMKTLDQELYQLQKLHEFKSSKQLTGVHDRDEVENWPTWDEMLRKLNLNMDVALFERIAQPIDKPKLPNSWKQLVQHYLNSVRQNTPNGDSLNVVDELKWMWESCVYTVQSLEMFLRAIDKPFRSELSIRHKSCLSGLIRLNCVHAASLTQIELKQLVATAIELLDTAFKQKGRSVLEWDCFSMMVNTLLLIPNMLFASTPDKGVVTNGSMMDYYTLQLYFLANLVKAMLLFDSPIATAARMNVYENDQNKHSGHTDDLLVQQVCNLPQKMLQNIADFHSKYNLALRRQTDSNPPTEADTPQEAAAVETTHTDSIDITSVGLTYNVQTVAALFAHIKTEMREFLRCCCLFFHFVTHVEFPEEFSTADSDTFENMCKYLGLPPTLETYFDDESCYAPILESFASHSDIVNYDFASGQKRDGSSFKVVPCIRRVPCLVRLPWDYSYMINSISGYVCPNNRREEMKSPTMCLTCGQILCGHSYCCRPDLDDRSVGACTYHSYFCGAEVGVFLRIRECQIVYLGRNKGSFVQPPYLDEYGETDQGLRRGNPLRLCPTRYRKIQLTWLGHGLHEEIARMNENAPIAVSQWHHM